MKIAVAITAAGKSLRFGSDKLMLRLGDSSLGESCLNLFSTFDFSDKVVVLNNDSSFLLSIASEYGYRTVINDRPSEGLSRSVVLALKSIISREVPDGILFATADMPFVSAVTVNKLISLFSQNSNYICAPAFNSVFGKPTIFPSWMYPELLKITGDSGGRTLIRQHPDFLKTISVSEKELIDIDTVSDAELWLTQQDN